MQSDHYITAINFCELSLDKSDHVMQNRTMVIGGYPLSDLIAFKLNFYKWSWKIKKKLFAEDSDGDIKSWLTIPYQETRTNPQNMQK